MLSTRTNYRLRGADTAMTETEKKKKGGIFQAVK
jgi:hypothetical protein